MLHVIICSYYLNNALGNYSEFSLLSNVITSLLFPDIQTCVRIIYYLRCAHRCQGFTEKLCMKCEFVLEMWQHVP